jgi:hypothetical protein
MKLVDRKDLEIGKKYKPTQDYPFVGEYIGTSKSGHEIYFKAVDIGPNSVSELLDVNGNWGKLGDTIPFLAFLKSPFIEVED